MISIFLFSSCAKETTHLINEAKDPDVTLETRTRNCKREYCKQLIPNVGNSTVIVQGCPVTVTYFYENCVNDNVNIVIIYNMVFTIGTNSACRKLLPTSFAGTFAATNSLINSIYREVSIAVEKEVLSKYYGFGTNWAVEFIETDCVSYCVKSQVDFEGTPYVTFSSIKCGESCCRRYTPYTKNGYISTQSGAPVITGDPICTDVTTAACTSGGGTNLGICNLACDRL